MESAVTGLLVKVSDILLFDISRNNSIPFTSGAVTII
jgi:hypothetical protein